jgi:hypothetical protein
MRFARFFKELPFSTVVGRAASSPLSAQRAGGWGTLWVPPGPTAGAIHCRRDLWKGQARIELRELEEVVIAHKQDDLKELKLLYANKELQNLSRIKFILSNTGYMLGLPHAQGQTGRLPS